MLLLQIILYAAALYNLTLAGLIFWKTRSRAGVSSFVWYIIATAGWTTCVATMQFRGHENHSLVLCRATFFCATIIGISWVWFCAQFPRPSRSFGRVAAVITTIGLPWFVMSWTGQMIPDIHFVSNVAEAGVGPLVVPFTVWLGIATLAGMVHLFYKVNRVRGLERLQVMYILTGAIGLAVAGSLPDLILPAITHSTRFAPLGPLASLFITTTTTYAIVRYRLMDIKIVLRAGLVYSVTIGMLSLLFALLVPVLNSALTTKLNLPAGAGSFVMAFLIALAFQPLRRQVQSMLDRRFFKSVYDYRLTLREAGSALASARDREVLVETLMSALVRTLRPHVTSVYLPGNEELLTRISVTGDWDELPELIVSTDPLLTYLIEMDDVLVREELLRQTDRQHKIGLRMKVWGIDVAVPLIAGGRLCGIVFLGEKLSGDVYTADDVGLLRILGKQAAIALDNARHYDEMVLLNEYHERLLHSMQDGVIALDPQGQTLTINPAAERILSIRGSAALGRSLEEIGLTEFSLVDSGDQATEVSLTRPNGVEIPALFTVTPFRRRWDTSDSHLIVFRDLSTLRALEAEKLQAQHFSSMGAMAASLAHEIKNPLVPIQMFAHLLPTKYDDDEFRKEFSVTVVKEVERINRLVGQMLDLVRKPSYDQGEVDIREVIERLLVLLHSDCERNQVTMHCTFSAGLPKVVGIAGQLYQAILNVLMNAVQAMPDGGEISITVESKGREVICLISDTGPGVPEENLSRLFEPLFTTKADGHGLGLALTYQFVRSNGGEVRAECAPGEGLTVTMFLPAWQRTDAELLCT